MTEARSAAGTFDQSAQPGRCDTCGAETRVAIVEDCYYFPYEQTIRQHLCWEHWQEWLLSGKTD